MANEATSAAHDPIEIALKNLIAHPIGRKRNRVLTQYFIQYDGFIIDAMKAGNTLAAIADAILQNVKEPTKPKETTARRQVAEYIRAHHPELSRRPRKHARPTPKPAIVVPIRTSQATPKSTSKTTSTALPNAAYQEDV
ncbi:MAG: hypothetical protein PXZ07_08250 [Candidatus Eremiobacteraeota bacterium]|nr:hypothetical protein [Candidatus Eremiobacteraeota bacterium]